MNTKKKRKKSMMIPEEKFVSDFAPLYGFYDYHVKGKEIDLALDDIQGFGVNLSPTKQENIMKIVNDTLPINTIVYSSSKKKYNVKNLAWPLRCLVSHPENIRLKTVNGIKCYIIKGSYKDHEKNKIIPTMKGIVACDLWPRFTKQLINRIKEL